MTDYNVSIEIQEDVTDITVTEEQVVIDITPEIVEVEVNNMAVPSIFIDASNVSMDPHGSISATNLQTAIEQLADQDFRSATTPTGSNIEEGDTWYNIDTDQFYVYRRINPTELAWVPIMVGNDSPDSDTLDAGAF
jgi:acyl transferase domain-containing protein